MIDTFFGESVKTDFAYVPFYTEQDGSKTFFLPHLCRKKGYQIGPKGSELYFDNYWVALGELMQMNEPRFRRPNRNGIPGIVSCAPGDVEEVARAHIETELMSKQIGKAK